ncbi:MAG TPA: flippase [bacterium]|nr:flippase [bacterium]
MKTASLKKNSYYVAIGQFFQKFLAFVTLPIAARALGDVGFGKYALASTVMFFVTLLNDLGINHLITREVARCRDNAADIVRNALWIKGGLVLVDILFLVLYLGLTRYPRDTNIAIILFSMYGVLTSISQLNIAVFQAFERMEFETIVIVLEKILATALGIFVLLKGWGLFAFCLVFVVSGFFSLILSFILLRRFFGLSLSGVPVSWRKLWDLLKNGFPLGLSLILATVYNYIGIIILSMIGSEQLVGWYSAAVRVLTITNIVPTILFAATYPRVSLAYQTDPMMIQSIFNRCIRYLTFLSLPMVAGAMFLAEPVVILIYGKEFMPTVPVFRIFIWAAALIFYNLFLSSLLKATNLQDKLIKIQIVGLVCNIILNVVLTPLFSYIGTAVAAVGTELVIFIGFVIVVRRRIARLSEFNGIKKIPWALGVMIFWIIMTRQHSMFWVIPTAAALYFMVLFILKAFTWDEISWKSIKRM